MNTIANKIAVAASGVLLALSLTACSAAETPSSTPTPVETVVDETPTPTPVETETPEVPEAVEIEGEVVERDADGNLILPDGTVTDCPEESKAVIIETDGSLTCDAGVSW